ncbi:tyrosine--tRNA ligase [Sphingobacteriales bacterium UPWRP_1]|nr:tyrosine--tRNA ligase [Sphingobacteriales bacterium TSM_CSM]PSJ77807.1 tyrosine--tRNA ligase [Sphingobacteriales bacterium UPWRP_1]
MTFLEELTWRGMVHNLTPGLEELMQKEQITGYWGIDPTAPSLTVGNLAAGMMLIHLQRAGHKPIALVGGATGMIGDPSGKSEERQLKSVEELQYNISRQKKQLEKLLNFSDTPNGALLLNNYNWFKDMPVLNFLRDVGKHLTVNYMMDKDSVKTRMETGISFTEFSYQLIQGYDFVYLYKHHNCKLQVGGSDQWGNITAGIELTRRMEQGEVFAVTCPLLTKADGTKFGKSEKGNIWLDPELTSPYQFYQFWLNASDEDARKFIRIFTFLTEEDILQLEQDQMNNPHLRPIQKRLAELVTTMIHGADEYQKAIQASAILFGEGTKEMLQALTEKQLLEIFDGVPQSVIARGEVETGTDLTTFLSVQTGVFASKGDARRNITANAVSINKQKIALPDYTVTTADLLNNTYILVQKGKKNYHLVVVK